MTRHGSALAFALLLLTTGAAQAAGSCSLSQADETYLQNAAAGSAYEQEIAALAVQKATDADIKRYADMVTRDHAAYNEALQGLARECSLTLQSAPDQQQQGKIATLRGLSGNLFDAAFITRAREINIQDAEDSKREASATQNPQLRAFLQKFKATDEKHTQAAEALNAEGPGHG